MFTCLFIAPNEAIQHIVEEIRPDYPFQIDVQIGNIKNGQQLIDYAENHAYDAIICRGGTAMLFRNRSNLPVIEIGVCGADLLQSFRLLKGYKGSIAIIGSANVISNVQLISELLEMDVLHIQIESEDEIQTAIQNASEQGIEVVVGDGLTCSFCEKLDMPSIMINLGRDAVVHALDQALSIYKVLKKKQSALVQYQEKLQSIKRGIRYYKNRQPFSMQQAERMLGIPALDLRNLQRWYIASEPILLLGESGVPLHNLSETIHLSGEKPLGSFIPFYAQAVEPESIYAELFGTGSDPLGATAMALGGTLFIYAIEALPLASQLTLASLLASNTGSFRFIAASSADLSALVQAGSFSAELFYILHRRTYTIAPLRDNKDIIPDIIRWLLANTNTNSKQVVAVKPDVLDKLIQYDWPGNYEELELTIERLVDKADGKFVTMLTSASIIEELYHQNNLTQLPGLFQTASTLEEMEALYIHMVLQQENYNQSKAAKRLGINRATLWRKLKNH